MPRGRRGRHVGGAERAMRDREIPREEAEAVLANPEAEEERPEGRRVVMGRYVDPRLGRDMLLRIIVDETPEERVVVTLYKTSQVSKYLVGGGQ